MRERAEVPALRTVLRGRDADIEALARLFTDETCRLISVVGPAGCGKTALALSATDSFTTLPRDGVAWIALAAVTDARRVPGEIARQLGIAVVADTDVADHLCEALAHREMLVVLDNFEQIVAAADMVEMLLAHCPGLQVLVTSRRRLKVPGERVLRVGAIDIDSAIQLFTDRASAVQMDFVTNPLRSTSVRSICEQVGCLPLAVELAASRVRHAPVSALSRMLTEDSGFRLLRDIGSRTTRHHSLATTIEWSVTLLSPAARHLFISLGVFTARFGLDDASAVCRTSDLGISEFFDTLSELVDLHLVDPDPAESDPPRYQLTLQVRSYAADLLSKSCRAQAVRRAHANHYLGKMLAAGPGLESREEHTWINRLENDIEEIRTALHWLRKVGRHDDAQQAAAALGPFWLHTGLFREGIDHLGFDGKPHLAPVEAHAAGWSIRLALDGGNLLARPDELDRAISELTGMLARFDHRTDRRLWLRTSEHLSYAQRLSWRVTDALATCTEALRECDPADLWWQAEFLHRMALVCGQSGDTAASARCARKALDAASKSGNERIRARALQTYTLVSGRQPKNRSAREVLEEVRDIGSRLGDARGVATTLPLLGATCDECGDDVAAARYYGEAIVLARNIRYWTAAGLAVVGLVCVAAARGDLLEAARMHGSIVRHLDLLKAQLFVADHGVAYDRHIAELEAALGADFDHLIVEGMSRDDSAALRHALRYATEVAVTPSARPVRERGQPRPSTVLPLTKRELEVLRLVAQGFTNDEIAKQLVLSPKTVMHHCGHIYAKLGVRGRAEAVARGINDGLLSE